MAELCFVDTNPEYELCLLRGFHTIKNNYTSHYRQRAAAYSKIKLIYSTGFEPTAVKLGFCHINTRIDRLLFKNEIQVKAIVAFNGKKVCFFIGFTNVLWC